MHSPAGAGAIAPPQPKSHIRLIAEQFQQDAISWLARIQHNDFAKQIIFAFLSQSDESKLKKNDQRLDLDALPFSILRMGKYDGSTVFRLISHDRIGAGAYGVIKVAFPLLFFGDSFMVQTHLPIALKIIHTASMNHPSYPVPTACSLQYLGKIYPETYAFANRPTETKKNQELKCDNKKYISTPLFDAIDLATFFEEHYKTLNGPKIISIFLRILDAIGKLHQDERILVHRDIKFENILIYPETHHVELIDYDACEKTGVETRMAGTLKYMRRDVKSKTIEVVSIDRDLYAFCCILKEMKLSNVYQPLNDFFGTLTGKIILGELANITAIKDELQRECPAANYAPLTHCAFGLEEQNIIVSLKPGIENRSPNTPPRPKRTPDEKERSLIKQPKLNFDT